VNSGPLSEIDAKLVKAAAITHQQTGLTIASHTGDGVAAMAQISALKSHGVAPAGFIWVHAQNEADTRLHRHAAEAGAWVEFDGISSAAAQKHVELVLGMKQAGYLSRVLLSQDSGWYHVGEPSGGNFRPYDFLLIEFLPLLGPRIAIARTLGLCCDSGMIAGVVSWPPVVFDWNAKVRRKDAS